MSEQNPPSGQPTPPPAEGEGPSTADSVNAPAEGTPPPPAEGEGPATADSVNAPAEGTPPPPPPAAPQAQHAPPPPPEKKSRKKGLVIGIVAAVVVLALVAGGAVALFSTLGGDPNHKIAIPSTAGGLTRDKAKETQLQQQLDAAEQQFQTQAKSVSYVKSGVYNQDDTKRGPKGALVFLGAKLKAAQSPAKFVKAFGDQATKNGFKIDNIAPGDGGGKAVCAYQSTGQKVAICAWATKDSMGELVPTVPGYGSQALAKILLDMRKDIETTE